MVFIEEKKLMFQVFSITFFVKFQEDFVVLPLLHMILRGNPGVCHAMVGTGLPVLVFSKPNITRPKLLLVKRIVNLWC